MRHPVLVTLALTLLAACAAPSGGGTTEQCAIGPRCGNDADCPAGTRCGPGPEHAVCSPIGCAAVGMPCFENANCDSNVCSLPTFRCAEPTIDLPRYSVCNGHAEGTSCNPAIDRNSLNESICRVMANASPVGGSLCTNPCGNSTGCDRGANGQDGVCAGVGAPVSPSDPEIRFYCLPGCAEGLCPAGFVCEDVTGSFWEGGRGEVRRPARACVPTP